MRSPYFLQSVLLSSFVWLGILQLSNFHIWTTSPQGPCFHRPREFRRVWCITWRTNGETRNGAVSYWKPIVEDKKGIQTLELEFDHAHLAFGKKIIYTYTYPLGYNYTSLNSWGRKEMSQQSWSFDWFDGETLRRGMTTQTPKEEGYTVQPRIFCDKSRHAALVSDIELISIFFDMKTRAGSLEESWTISYSFMAA